MKLMFKYFLIYPNEFMYFYLNIFDELYAQKVHLEHCWIEIMLIISFHTQIQVYSLNSSNTFTINMIHFHKPKYFIAEKPLITFH